MKRTLRIALISLVLLAPAALALAGSQPAGDSSGGFSGLIPCGWGKADASLQTCTWNDAITFVNKLVTFLIFDLAIPVSVIVIIVSGIELVMHPSSATATSLWKSRFKNGLYGLLLALSAYLIVKAVIVGVTDGRDNYQLQNVLSQ